MAEVQPHNLGQHVRITMVFSELKMIKRIWLLRGGEDGRRGDGAGGDVEERGHAETPTGNPRPGVTVTRSGGPAPSSNQCVWWWVWRLAGSGDPEWNGQARRDVVVVPACLLKPI
jgi:hypothetical protein